MRGPRHRVKTRGVESSIGKVNLVDLRILLKRAPLAPLVEPLPFSYPTRSLFNTNVAWVD